MAVEIAIAPDLRDAAANPEGIVANRFAAAGRKAASVGPVQAACVAAASTASTASPSRSTMVSIVAASTI